MRVASDPEVGYRTGLSRVPECELLPTLNVAPMDVAVPGEVVEVPLRTGDHESCRKYDRMSAATMGSRARVLGAGVVEVEARVRCQAVAPRTNQVLREDASGDSADAILVAEEGGLSEEFHIKLGGESRFLHAPRRRGVPVVNTRDHHGKTR